MDKESDTESLLSIDSNTDSESSNPRELSTQKNKSGAKLTFTTAQKKSPQSIKSSPKKSNLPTEIGPSNRNMRDTPSTSKGISISSSSSSASDDEVETQNVGPRVLENEEIILSDDENRNDDAARNDEESVARPAGHASGSNSRSGYQLRRKHKVNYAEIGNPFGGQEDEDVKRAKKEVFDVFSLSSSKLDKLCKDVSSIDFYTKCKIVFFDGTDSIKLAKVSKLFSKCGSQFENIFIQTRNSPDEVYPFLHEILKSTSILTRVHYRYHDQEDAFRFLKLVDKLFQRSHLQHLTAIKLISISGSEYMRERHISLLAKIPAKWTSLELGDALWEDVNVGTIETLLFTQSSSLESLIIHGGFRGESMKERVVINIPKMSALKTLCLCPNYDFISEIKNPYSKKQRIVTIGGQQEEPYKISIKFLSDPPKLERLILGNLIEMDDLHFSTLRKLREFRCGSYWNLSITFPSPSSRKALLESDVTDFQFPDALKDPTFPVQVVKYFPNIKKIWINLPSVPVLRAFFKAFENSKLENLYLKTQFDFESTMESCLLPRLEDVLNRGEATTTILNTLKEYKHFEEYVKYYNVELPVEQDDLMEGHSEGIGALKNLKVLHLEHVPRKLLIPIPDDERKWFDHNCKFMSTTFGYISYPLKQKVHREILKLDLSEYIWKNIQISSAFTDDFHEAGFVDISDETAEIMGYEQWTYAGEDDDEDMFTPLQRKAMSKGTHVKIMPSMLAPVFKTKPESV